MEDDTILPNQENPSLDQPGQGGSFRHPPEESTLVFKRSHLYTVLLPLAFVLGLSVGYIFWGRAPVAGAAPQAAVPQAATPSDQQAAAEAQQAVQRYDVPVDDDPAIGPEDAPITIIGFSDYECPYCRRWHEQVFTRLRQEYPDQVRIIYRDFPLKSIHPNAVPAAEAANCANEQEAFWEFNDKLFSGEYALSDDDYLRIATDLGLDAQAFEQCYSSGRYADEVEADYQYAGNLGVRSTPTFFLNGLPIVGAQPYEVFKDVIDKELAGEIPE
jgi:protein-disulfide isomerase